MKWLMFCRKSSLNIALVFGTLGHISAQEKPDTINNLYCIGVKQSFASSGDCNSDPDFEFAEIDLLFNGSETIHKTVYPDSLNTLIIFPGNFYTVEINAPFIPLARPACPPLA